MKTENDPSLHPHANIIPGFRAILHGGDYSPEQWLHAPQVLEQDRRLRRLAGCNAFSVGIFSWSHLEPREGVFEFGWLDRVMDDLAEDGCKAILATPSAARPPWMARKYPEVMRTGRDRRREEFNSRHNFCWSLPVFREKVREINERLAMRYKEHPALGLWHISNELGGNAGLGECFCDLCLGRWHQWLEQRYQTIDALNEAWWAGFWSHRFTCWEEINPSDPTLDGCALDWSRFVNFLMREWIEFEASTLRPHTPDVPVTTNFMGVNPWIDYAELARAVDVVADDQYPALFASKPNLEDSLLATAFKHDLQRNYLPGRPFFLMESCPETPQWHHPQALKHEHLHRAEMLQAIGHGAEGTCYFQWRKGRGGIERLHGAVVDHEGTERTRTFGIVKRLSETYDALKPVLGSRRKAEVVVLYDHDSRRAHELGSGLQGGGYQYLLEAQEHYRTYWRHGMPVDVLDSRRNWETRRVVVAPMLYLLHEGVAGRIRRHVENGGIFVATTLTACTDATLRCLQHGWPGDGLREVFGLWDEEADHLPEGSTLGILSAEGGSRIGAAYSVASVVHPEGAEVLAQFGEGTGIPCGHPAILRRRVGKGGVFYAAGRLDRSALGWLHKEVMREAGIAGPFVDELPPGLVFSMRADGEHEFWFFANIAEEACHLRLREQFEADRLAGEGEWEQVISVPPRSDAVWRVKRSGGGPCCARA